MTSKDGSFAVVACGRPVAKAPVPRSVQLLPSEDIGQFAWTRLRNFQNIGFVADAICERHQITGKHKKNAQKQAAQLRFCLIQSKEYYDASLHVSSATRPVLIYYSIMSLALAEILWKQDGLSSLDKARAKHAHHGLTFSPQFPRSVRLMDRASKLVAKPENRPDNGRFGTFELWHRTSRMSHQVGERVNHIKSVGITTAPTCLLFEKNERPPLLPISGVTLYDCMRYLPGLENFLPTVGGRSALVRCRLQAESHDHPYFHIYYRLVSAL